jgi:hypothetical protein
MMDFAEAIIKLKNEIKNAEHHERHKDYELAMDSLNFMASCLFEARFYVANKIKEGKK